MVFLGPPKPLGQYLWSTQPEALINNKQWREQDAENTFINVIGLSIQNRFSRG